ncbi:MAG: MltA domain-containing protein [Parvularculaceae bacterium]
MTLTLTGVIGGGEKKRPEPVLRPAGLTARLADFNEIRGWRSDAIDAALAPFLLSCARIDALADDARVNPSEYLGENAPVGATLSGVAADWRTPCAEAKAIAARTYIDDSARAAGARIFFEYFFRPIQLVAKLEPEWGGGAPKLDKLGLFTGYFEPTYEASRYRSAVYSAPVYARPADLVTVDLGRFRPELSGQRVAGRVERGALYPYPDHAAINAGALAGRARVIAYMRPSDLLYLQIQGSGRLRFSDGELRLGYDGANGRPYTPIGKTLVDMGALARENVSMQTIREWFDRAPDADARKVRRSNRSFVFFRVVDEALDPALGPAGSQGVQLTAGRSIAVDTRYAPFGAPVFVSVSDENEDGLPPLRRLLIAQDSGGAIKGAVRGDIFVGSGPRAGDIAGQMRQMGEMYILLPAALVDRLPPGALSK